MSDSSSASEDDFTFAEPMGYLYEPEYTDDELRQMDSERAERERRAREDATAAATQRPRENDTWWCSCDGCGPMPTERESYCYREWDLAMPVLKQMQESRICSNTGMARSQMLQQELSGEANSSEAAAAQPVSNSCIINHPEFPHITSRGVLRTLFHVPKINWRKRPKPAGPNGELSVE